MVDSRRILMVIPARGGSKRLPRKNVLLLAGKPLICWTIEVALEAGLDARVLVTSDDEEILAVARQYESKGVIVHKRANELATDTATTVDALVDAVAVERLAGYSPDTIVLLQPTSPLRTSKDICDAVDLFSSNKSRDTVVSVCEVDHPTAWVGVLGKNARFSGIDLSGKRSQDYGKEYRLNGAVYVAKTDILMDGKTLFTKRLRAFVMPRSRSFDIDGEVDFKICESVFNIGNFS